MNKSYNDGHGYNRRLDNLPITGMPGELLLRNCP